MKIKLPVTWEVFGIVEVEANSIEEAMEKFDETCDLIPLPDGDYVDGSFDLSCREMDYIELFQNE